MRVALLTTDTLHHAWFLRELAGAHEMASVLLETRSAAPPFPCSHAYEADRDAHERGLFFSGRDASVRDFAACREFPDVNAPEAVASLAEAAPEALIVFGTGKLRGTLLESFAGKLINLHGGDPEEYRGLDSHLWAVYHRDFPALVSTLHFVERDLDTGGIIGQEAVPLRRGMGLHELRAANTVTCLSLCLSALEARARLGRFPSRPQRRRGRYYSAMPAALKEMCLRKFRAHTEALP